MEMPDAAAAPEVLVVEGLRKNYPGFSLKDVSFSVQRGRITGFIGRNGAGKTTTLSSLFNLVHPDAGEVRFFGKPFLEAELELKRRVSFVSGGVNFYTQKKLSLITRVTKAFYPEWDDGAYASYLKLFKLDENKTPAQLSAGMKVKYALALALSHGAELLILDEPTSGLDPVSRDELLSLFIELCDKGIAILFSTHITSDLDACADDIVYIKDGAILAAADRKEWVARYRVASFAERPSEEGSLSKLIGLKRVKEGYRALVKAEEAPSLGPAAVCGAADLEAIMIHMEND